ncbi:MerR family transcriptional regulator [Ruminococcus albus SY3]|uniref:MerR family transcriptional regulator n=1 Tax=Ruminococcus albus SY3 TaxID=1341156 RepID=A0A011VXC8_RUMAL|nr:DNA-binding protein [Ruminococcus albus]EXM39926.1 MerR family transcriptional regulator [Ruminococcus albus SY3]
MTKEQKTEFMCKLMALIDEYIDVEELDSEYEPSKATAPKAPTEMLTIKECTQQFEGISEHTIRQLALRGEIASFRAGTGKNGKILINKTSLMKKLGFI